MTADPPSGDEPTIPVAEGAAAAATPGATYGRFVVERWLGAGGMGVVFVARDPELDRRVALKLLRPELATGDVDGSARLVREAQAMAKLAHPNVVGVHEVGRAGDQVFVAMELVDGQTLRAWLAERPRTWREILAIFVAAGRGLAAAHAAGLVHRDVKPENVLVGRDGRPRVTDFGLVSGGVAPRPDAVGDALLTGQSVGGAPVGTPAYMSAEQWAGEVVDARSDQFSFCVALWDAVYGARPFPGKSGPDLSAKVRAGEIATPPGGHGAPAWLESVLRRGLAVDPAARWPSMTALLDELERRAAGHRRSLRIAAAFAAPLAAGLLVGVLTRGQGERDACPAPTARIDAVWGEPRQQAVRDHLRAIDPVLGEARFDTAARAFDAGLGAWSVEHVRACRATRVEGSRSDTLFDQQMRCLDRWLRGVDGTVAILERAGSREQLDQVIAAVTGLDAPTRCGDVEALAATPPPAGAEAQAEARAIQDELDALHLARLGGELTGAPERAHAVVERARRLDHPPTLADALEGAVKVLIEADEPTEPLLEELARVASIAGDDRAVAYAWIKLVGVRGATLDRPEQAEALYATADAAVLRAGDPPALRFDLLLARTSVLIEHGRTAEAFPLIDQAEALLAGVADDALPADRIDYRAQALFERARALEHAGDAAKAVEVYREAIALRTQQLGPDHVDVARAQVNLGETLRQLGRGDEAAAAYQDAARIVEARVGESAMLAIVLDRLGATHYERRESDRAVPLFERAVAIGDARLPADHPYRGIFHSDLASAYWDLGRLDDALAHFELSIGLDEANGRRTTNTAIGYYNRGNVLGDLGRRDDQIADYRRAIALMDELGTDPYFLIPMLLGLGDALLDAGRPAEALTALERAMTIPTPGHSAGLRPLIEFNLARAHVELGRDVRRNLARARALRAGLPEDEVGPKTLAKLDGWLAKHRGR